MATGGPARTPMGGEEVTLSGQSRDVDISTSPLQNENLFPATWVSIVGPTMVQYRSISFIKLSKLKRRYCARRRWVGWNNRSFFFQIYLAIEIRHSPAVRRRRRSGRPDPCRRLPHSSARWGWPAASCQRIRCGCAADPWAAGSKWWCSWWKPPVPSCIRLSEHRAVRVQQRRNGNDHLGFSFGFVIVKQNRKQQKLIIGFLDGPEINKIKGGQKRGGVGRMQFKWT